MAAQRQAWISEWQAPSAVNSRLVNSRNKRRHTGVAVALAAFLALWWNAPQGDWWQSGRTAICGMWCASPSGRVSLGAALCRTRNIPRPRALSRRFPGRQVLLRLCAMTLILRCWSPFSAFLASMVARAGWPALAITWSGVDLFALRPARHLLAHVFFNLPMASRLLLQALETFPANNVSLPHNLGCAAGTLPLRRMAVVTATNPAGCCAYFMLCFASFATVLSLGGGPQGPLSSWQSIRR